MERTTSGEIWEKALRLCGLGRELSVVEILEDEPPSLTVLFAQNSSYKDLDSENTDCEEGPCQTEI
jgi:hypothetical protein